MFKLLLGDPNARKLKRYQPIVSEILLLEEEIASLSDDELRGKTVVFKERLANVGTLSEQRPLLDEILPKPSRLSAKQASVFLACGTSMFSLSGAWCSMRVRSLR